MLSMADKDEGGPAFPVIAENGMGHVSDGMYLRDWFAGHALSALISSRGMPMYEASQQDAAQQAYQLADALLAERDK